METTHAVPVEACQESIPLTKQEPTSSRRRIALIAIATIAVVVLCVSFLPLSSGTEDDDSIYSNSLEARFDPTYYESEEKSMFTCEQIITDPRPSIDNYLDCRRECSTVVTIPGIVCHGFTFLWRTRQCYLQMAILFDETRQGEITLQRNSPKLRSLYCSTTRSEEITEKLGYKCLKGEDQVKLDRSMEADRCMRRCRRNRKCTGFLHDPNDHSCTIFLRRPNRYEPNSVERCFLPIKKPVTCPCFSQRDAMNAVDFIVERDIEVVDGSCQVDNPMRKGFSYNPSSDGSRYQGFEIIHSGDEATCVIDGDSYFTLTKAEAKQCTIQIDNACSTLISRTECPSDCFSEQDMKNALDMVRTGEVQLDGRSCESSDDGISFSYNKIKFARRLAQLPGEYFSDTFAVGRNPTSCFRTDFAIEISPIEYMKCQSLIEETCSKFQRPLCPCFTSNHVQQIVSDIKIGVTELNEEKSCIAYPGAREIVYTDSRERFFKVNKRLPTCVTPFGDTVLMSAEEADECLDILSDACTELIDDKDLEEDCPCFSESDVSSAYEEQSRVSEFSCDPSSEHSLILSYDIPNSDVRQKFGVYKTPRTSCGNQDARRFITDQEYNKCRGILEDACAKVEKPTCPCFTSEQISKEVSDINNGNTILVPKTSCSQNKNGSFGLYSKYVDVAKPRDVGIPLSNPIFSVSEVDNSCRSHDVLILTSDMELQTCRSILEDACDSIDLPECPCFSSDELNQKILLTQNESYELQTCETDDEGSTFFITLDPYHFTRGQRPGTKLVWNYSVSSNSLGNTCSRLDTKRLITPLEWKSCELKLQSACEEVRKPKTEICPCFSSLELHETVQSVKESRLSVDEEKSCLPQRGTKEIFLNTGSKVSHYKVDHRRLTCLSPILEEELDVSTNEAGICQSLLENACSQLDE